MEQNNSSNREELLTQVLAQELLNREQDLSPSASSFSSVSGVLGGFSITLVVLALTPQMITKNSLKDCIVSVILLSASLYIYSSGIFANSISFEEKSTKKLVFDVALLVFHLSNFLLSTGILISTLQFELIVARIIALIITISSFLVMTINISRIFKTGLRNILSVILMSISS